jgi:hypothetical protein
MKSFTFTGGKDGLHMWTLYTFLTWYLIADKVDLYTNNYIYLWNIISDANSEFNLIYSHARLIIIISLKYLHTLRPGASVSFRLWAVITVTVTTHGCSRSTWGRGSFSLYSCFSRPALKLTHGTAVVCLVTSRSPICREGLRNPRKRMVVIGIQDFDLGTFFTSLQNVKTEIMCWISC